MHRSQVLQAILDRKTAPTYLEIGVFKGQVFQPMRAGKKIAVDPQFRLRPFRKLVTTITNPRNLTNQYFEMTSDEFFEKHSDALAGGIDVAFVDGLHTSKQSYKDVQNCLRFLKPDGVIVMHDCDPPSAMSADPNRPSVISTRKGDIPKEERIWTGDVFKALVRLRAEHDDLHVFVLDTDFGLGILRKGAPEGMVDLPVGAISELTFDEFLPRRQELLNLKPVTYFDGWLRDVA